VAYVPPQVMFASTSAKADRGDTKDSVANIRNTGVFCVNIVEYAMRDVMNASSAGLPADVDEFAHAGIEQAACSEIDCARVAKAPAALECRMTEIIKIKGEHNFVVFGEVVGVHIRDDALVDGRFDVTTFQPLSRMGYRDYTRVTEIFELIRPDE
jgi:flavin reductase (DIM6/NTAB) family NADH-FMN oxidoreductase RutF